MATKKGDRQELDPADGLPRDLIGEWAAEKHQRLEHYIDIASAARRKFITGGSRPAYIDLYCATGRGRVRETEQVVDGSPIVAARTAMARAPFAEIHVGDIEGANVAACCQRLERLGARNVNGYVGAAEVTAGEVVRRLNPYGLHLALLDPYNLEALPFCVVETLGALKRMDLIIHVSEMDLQRNVIGQGQNKLLDGFAPGWREAVDLQQPSHVVKTQFLGHYRSLLTRLGYRVSDNIERVKGGKNQPLYWLVFASRSDLADGFWGQISNVEPQGRFGF